MNKRMKRLIKKLKRGRIKRFDFSFKKLLKRSSSNKFSILEVVLLLFVTLVFGVMVGYFITFNFRSSSNIVPQSLVSEVYDGILNNYYKEVDVDDLDKAAIKGIIDYLNDENTVELEDDHYLALQEQINGYFCGIGVSVTYENDKLVVINVLEDSAAFKKGIKVNDVITSVDGIIIDSENYIDLIKGKCGTKVTLDVERNDEQLIFVITREAVSLNHITSQYFDVNDKYVGYIDIDVFSYNSHELFEQHLKRLEDKKIKSLIIDLRNNPGGAVTSTRNILNNFFKKNTTLYTFKSRNKKTVMKDGTIESRDYPVVILMNEDTASAAEIFISCFKENYQNVTLIGKNTYGKNTIQTNLSLTDDYAIKYTTSEWFSSLGNSVKGYGIVPDIEIANGGSSYFEDYQLQAAINLLK